MIDIWNKGFRNFSQNNEDGLIEYIFNNIKFKNKIVFEICAGDGIECNAANLIINHDFNAFLFDGNYNEIKKGIDFYSNNEKVRFICDWITCENIKDLIDKTCLITNEIDLLSLDVDGNDYWILKEIIQNDLLNPRVIVLEYQDILGPFMSLTIPYDPKFNAWEHDCYGGPNYCGASLKAFINLLKDKYVFVFCEEKGFNAFFIRIDEYEKQTEIKECTDIKVCFEIPKVKFGIENRFPRVRNLEWISL